MTLTTQLPFEREKQVICIYYWIQIRQFKPYLFTELIMDIIQQYTDKIMAWTVYNTLKKIIRQQHKRIILKIACVYTKH